LIPTEKEILLMATIIKLIHTSDPYTKLKPGDTGVLLESQIERQTGQQILHVKWDSGSTLKLISGHDAWQIVKDGSRV
jgi:hypothetical protein